MPTYLEDEIIRIAAKAGAEAAIQKEAEKKKELENCLLYTSDAADE